MKDGVSKSKNEVKKGQNVDFLCNSERRYVLFFENYLFEEVTKYKSR
jgi:hypothetical protein